MVIVRPVHGSIRFGLNHKNHLNRVTQIFENSNRTKPNFGSNRTSSVWLNSVFCFKTGKLNHQINGIF